MKDKKTILTALIAFICGALIATAVFMIALSQSSSQEDTSQTDSTDNISEESEDNFLYSMTDEERLMPTFDLLVSFCDSYYMQALDKLYNYALLSSVYIDIDMLPKCDAHEAYRELLTRSDLREAYQKMSDMPSGERPSAFMVLVFQEDFERIMGEETVSCQS